MVLTTILNHILHGVKVLSLLSFSTFLRTIAPFFERILSSAVIQNFIEVIRQMVTIRLSRTGAKRNPYYHVVVIDSRKKDSGRPLERLGFFNPSATGQEISLKLEMDRIDHWVSQGAQLSERVSKLIKDNAVSAAA